MQDSLFFSSIKIDVRSVYVTWNIVWGRDLVYRLQTPPLPDQKKRDLLEEVLGRLENQA